MQTVLWAQANIQEKTNEHCENKTHKPQYTNPQPQYTRLKPLYTIPKPYIQLRSREPGEKPGTAWLWRSPFESVEENPLYQDIKHDGYAVNLIAYVDQWTQSELCSTFVFDTGASAAVSMGKTYAFNFVFDTCASAAVSMGKSRICMHGVVRICLFKQQNLPKSPPKGSLFSPPKRAGRELAQNWILEKTKLLRELDHILTTFPLWTYWETSRQAKTGNRHARLGKSS